MDDAVRFPSESSEHTPESTTDLNIPQTDSGGPYQLTVKRGFLALLVMYAGKLVELRPVRPLFNDPLHPYSEGLLKSVPNIKLLGDELYKMGGSPPDLVSPPSGCRFHPRCPKVMDICSKASPTFQDTGDYQFTACWLYEDRPEMNKRDN